MSSTSLSLDAEVSDYLIAHTLRDSDVKSALRKETALLTMGRMQICPRTGSL